MRSRPIALLAAAALAAVPPATAAASAPHPGFPADLVLRGHADHRRPIPNEVQVVRWTVRDLGTRPVSEVTLNATVPETWRLRDGAGCILRERGHLTCTLGALTRHQTRSVRFELAVPRHPRLGVEHYRARTRFTVDGTDYDGPSAHMQVEVVRHR
ncbi:hypothetical protein [Actinomadura harenae]|uniref:DUF11 domain-containing protein n=1 Tax=Actinomadura harenae TaxID=2483351 RepID=A0A3M2M1X7_9ACTN|nr:hypothetical protein [Actinomadura harenae]RMI42455.1 hypothetical protein EBO15_19710 [Actinomadura harenae]